MGFPNKIFYFFLFFIAGTCFSFSQGDRCSNIQPFCAGAHEYVFSNSNSENTNNSEAETGPYYACLIGRPYPAWFYLKVGQSGALDFEIGQTVNPDGSGKTLDVDFIAWGPFSENDDFCNGNYLSKPNVVGCSYSIATSENLSIPNAKTGEIYVVLITNYSEKPGYISLSQTNISSPNAGSTDCSIVDVLGDDQFLCGAKQTELEVLNINADTYKWYQYNDIAGDFVLVPGETDSNYTVTASGRYKVIAINLVTNTSVSDEINIQFAPAPVAVQPENLHSCSNLETAIFNLNEVDAALLENYAGDTSYNANFYTSMTNADAGNPIANPAVFEGMENQEIFATIAKEGESCASQIVSFQLKIDALPEIQFPEVVNLCVDKNGMLLNTKSLGENLGTGYTYDWSPDNDPDGDGTENAIFNIEELPKADTIAVKITNKVTGCTSNFKSPVQVFYPISEVVVTSMGSDFEDGYTVAASVTSTNTNSENFEYRLDNGDWQSPSTFSGVSAGSHTVTAREVNGCQEKTSPVFKLIGYPRYFTPNADGYHDTWNIVNNQSGGINIKQIFIFNRLGKLLKQLNPNGAGWNGTFGGKALPADDYWFLIKYHDSQKNEDGQYKGHFSLKR